MGVQDFFSSLFVKATFEHGYVSVLSSLISQLPRYILEFLGVLVICSIFLLMFSIDNSPEEILITVSIFAASALKIIPSINKILSSYSQLIYTSPSLGILSSEFQDYKKYSKRENKISYNNKIEINNLSFSYSKKNKVLNGVNLVIKKGEFIGIKGPSGSGKSTFINTFIGLLDMTSGEIIVDGNKIDTKQQSWRDLIGYVPQQVFFLTHL